MMMMMMMMLAACRRLITICKYVCVCVCVVGQTIETEQRSRDEAREQQQASERRAMVLAGEIEELRAHVEASERARKIAEGELHEASDRVSELSTSASSFSAQKRKLENDIQAMHVRQSVVDRSISLLGPFRGAIAVPSVTRCRCCRRRRCCCGYRFYIAIHQVSLLSHASCAIGRVSYIRINLCYFCFR